MKIKRFIAQDARNALAQARAELGSQAVILSNKTVNGQVELVAAIDIDAVVKDGFDTAAVKPEQQTPEVPDNRMLLNLQEEMGNLRSILETELSQLGWRDLASLSPVKAALTNRLIKLGLSKKLCGELVDNLPVEGGLKEQWVRSLAMLSRKLPVSEDDLIDQGGIVALVGSTGVGKTTTVAKLAARAIMRHGNREVALITTDCYRIGGQEQLETFARYLEIPLLVATSAEEIQAALARFSSRRLVLIDTAGMSQKDVRLYEQFATLNATGYKIDSYAVLSATAMPGISQEVIRTFSATALAGCFITKLDESTCLGGLLDIIIRYRLKVGYVSNGQKVPEDILVARAENLVVRAVEMMEAETRRQAEIERESKNPPIAI